MTRLKTLVVQSAEDSLIMSESGPDTWWMRNLNVKKVRKYSRICVSKTFRTIHANYIILILKSRNILHLLNNLSWKVSVSSFGGSLFSFLDILDS